jgi:hypothetical protein
MPTYRLLAAAAVLLGIAGPAAAQQAMSEPGYCAFYYPNANCQNKGPGNPYTDAEYKRRLNQGGPVYGSDQTVGVARKRPSSSAMRMQ